MNWKSALTIIATIAMLLLAINQAFGWFYKVQLATTPCDLCAELNPHLKECFETPKLISKNTGEEINWFLNMS